MSHSRHVYRRYHLILMFRTLILWTLKLALAKGLRMWVVNAHSTDRESEHVGGAGGRCSPGGDRERDETPSYHTSRRRNDMSRRARRESPLSSVDYLLLRHPEQPPRGERTTVVRRDRTLDGPRKRVRWRRRQALPLRVATGARSLRNLPTKLTFQRVRRENPVRSPCLVCGSTHPYGAAGRTTVVRIECTFGGP
jgi:hypothetical protein